MRNQFCGQINLRESLTPLKFAIKSEYANLTSKWKEKAVKLTAACPRCNAIKHILSRVMVSISKKNILQGMWNCAFSKKLKIFPNNKTNKQKKRATRRIIAMESIYQRTTKNQCSSPSWQAHYNGTNSISPSM